MAYGELKVDSITFTDGGSDTTVSVSGLVKNPTFSGDIVVSGNISGITITGDSAGFGSVTGVTVTGTTANFVSGVFTSQVSGAVVTGNTAGFTTVTGTTVTGTTANFVTVSGTTVTGDAAQFTSITGGTAGFTTVTGTTVTGTTANFVTVSGTAITGNTAGFTTVTGTTVTGTTANFNTVSGTTVTGGTGNFTSISATTTTITSGVFASGTAAVPSVSVGTTDNGLYSPGTDQVAISTNGTGRLFVDSSGNVGVGTASPSKPLHISSADDTPLLVEHSDGISAFIQIKNTGGSASVSSSNNDLRFLPGEVEKLRITSDGKLGLGTSSPAGTLSVSNDTEGDVYFKANSGDGFTDRGLEIKSGTGLFEGSKHILDAKSSGGQLEFRTAGTPALFINQSQQVGIGTTSPDSKLEINSASPGALFDALDLHNETTNTAGTATRIRMPVWNGTAGFSITSYGNASDNYDAVISTGQGSSSLRFESANGQEAMRLDSSQRLLVGTSSAIDNSTGTLLQLKQNDNPASIALGRNDGVITAGDELGNIKFYGTEQGTTPYEFSAQIGGHADGSWTASSFPSRLVFSVTADEASSPTERMRINSAGNVLLSNDLLIGLDDTSSAKNDLVNGTTQSGLQYDNGTYLAVSRSGGTCAIINRTTSDGTLISFRQDGSEEGSISVSGSTVSYNTSSDYRLKENVVPLTGAADRLKQLKPSQFNFIASPDTTVDGFIAHEAQAVVPECVTGTKDEVDDEGNPVYQGIDQSKLVPLLTAALQEALAEIESLKARVTALEP